MNAKRPATITPEAALERAKRTIAEGVSDLVEAYLAKGAATSDWIDQAHSPLGRRRHLDLVRQGKLPARKDGKKMLVRRSDIDRYLDGDDRAVVPTQKPVGADEVDAIMEEILAGAAK